MSDQMLNRGFKFGDSVFDTLYFNGKNIEFLEDHYFRLMSSMRMLRMKIPMDFTLEHYEGLLINFLEEKGLKEPASQAEGHQQDQGAWLRFSVFRNGGGRYRPETNEISYVVEGDKFSGRHSTAERIELFKDYYINPDLLSTLKTNNRLINVLGSIFAEENGFDNCLLINQKKEVAEASNANVFLIKGDEVYSPPLSTGCLNGIMRKKVIESLKGHPGYTFKEEAFTPFELLKADALFLTNSLQGIMPVKAYRKKTYDLETVQAIREAFEAKFATAK